MNTTEAIEDRQRCRQLITIIKGTHIGIAVGLGVDGSSKVILCPDIPIDSRQKPAYSASLCGFIVVEFERCLSHLVVVSHGICHTLLHGELLCLGFASLHRGKNETDNNCRFHTLNVIFWLQR